MPPNHRLFCASLRLLPVPHFPPIPPPLALEESSGLPVSHAIHSHRLPKQPEMDHGKGLEGRGWKCKPDAGEEALLDDLRLREDAQACKMPSR